MVPSHYRLLLLSTFSAGLPPYSVVFLYSSSNQLTFSLHNFNTNIFKPYTKTQSLHSQQITSHLTSKRKSLQAQISPNCLSSPVSVCACANLLNQLAFFPRVSCNSASLPFYKIYLWLFSKPHSFKNVPFITLPLPLSLPSMHKLFMSLPSVKKNLHCWWFIIRSSNPVSTLICPRLGPERLTSVDSITHTPLKAGFLLSLSNRRRLQQDRRAKCLSPFHHPQPWSVPKHHCLPLCQGCEY